MRRDLHGLVVAAVVCGLAWLGFAHEVKGALNLVQLYLWAFVVPGAVALLLPAIQQALARQPALPVPHWLVKWPQRVLWWSSIAAFGWHGYWITTAAMLVCTVLFRMSAEMINSLRAANAAADNGGPP